jgi:hypothetical protein
MTRLRAAVALAAVLAILPVRLHAASGVTVSLAPLVLILLLTAAAALSLAVARLVIRYPSAPYWRGQTNWRPA